MEGNFIRMPPAIKYTKNIWDTNYTEIIDVRSPSEFRHDHIPGSINLPVLDDSERAEVGNIYKKISPFRARKIGAALVTKNISQYLIKYFINKDKDYLPLVYCWRGGQRSASMAAVLSEIGWQVVILLGGYKTYRTYVRKALEDLPNRFTYRIISGLTGSGKTLILRQLSQRGAQVLDLESLANHRGSLLGEIWANESLPQPSQKYFETLIVQQLQKFHSHQIVWVESESSKIGRVYLPIYLWRKMHISSCMQIQVPLDVRVSFIIQEYSHLVNNPDLLKAKIVRLKSRYGSNIISEWDNLITSSDAQKFVKSILQSHYDPAYFKSLKNNYLKIQPTFYLENLSTPTIENLVDFLIHNNMLY